MDMSYGIFFERGVVMPKKRMQSDRQTVDARRYVQPEARVFKV